MCRYRERLRPPVGWWLLGLTVLILFGPELVVPFTKIEFPSTAIQAGLITAALVAGWAALLLAMGRAEVTVTGTELCVGTQRLPLAAIGETIPLTADQTRRLRGPQADPTARVLLRPYLRCAVVVKVQDPAAGLPYWLIGTRDPDGLAAAVTAACSAVGAGQAAVG